MKHRVALLLLSYSLDDLCDLIGLDKQVVVNYLIDEGHLDLKDFFQDEETE